MFFTECARLAEQHPDLASVFERLDSRLRTMGTTAVIRSDDLASFLSIDPNQVRSVLQMLAQGGVLRRDEMIECTYCQMAAPRAEYQEALDEDDEYRCTSCDRPLTGRTIQIISAYRRGEKWPEVSTPPPSSGATGPREALSSTTSGVILDDQGWYTHSRLAESYRVGKEALRKRLDRYRKGHFDGWKTNDDHRPREGNYLYQLRVVRPIIEELLASSQRPAK